MFYSNKPTEPTQKKTFQKDERYIDFVKTHKSLKTTINKIIDETDDYTEKARLEGLLKKNVLKYEFVIIPFKELNFLEWATFNATWDNDSQKFIGSTINSPFNYIKSGYKSENLQHQYDEHFSDLMTRSKTRNEDGVTAPQIFYFMEQKKQGLGKEYGLNGGKEFLTQIYIINDPINPNNNGKIKLTKFTISPLKNVANIVNSDNIKKVKELKEEDTSPAIEKQIEQINKEMDLNFETVLKSLNHSITVKFSMSPSAKTLEIYDDMEVNPLSSKIDLSGQFNLRDLIVEFKDKYIPQKLRENLSRLGLNEYRIFEYKAYYDLHRHLDGQPNKLKIFNTFNLFNFDDRLNYMDNYEPTLPILKSKGSTVRESNLEVNETVSSNVGNFDYNSQTDVKGHIYDLDDLDNIPF